ncbi:phospholipid scramblase 1 [Eupeodes corollae]|uniref:phospholipid scramblase 1 n=1 Tax=Eupeodes corollae TaxID=290404 RepID=UPI002491BA26|nr:phospholipid scramblase 1 [Eupeodes corollae]XP_055919341.1 phospholipid scramblase 1 [Eupeodes corollae]XP_055919342.1 phospholipid scramblase 1 [Eupeodes corollae]
MLQDNSVRNLQYDREIRVAQQPRFDPTVFEGPTSITSVPREPQGNLRIPLPVSTIENQPTNGSRTYIPLSGYDILADLPSVHIEQTFELNATLTSVSSENRYTVRSPFGDAIFSASESSTSNHRLCWGSNRPFQMHILDKTHQEALSLHRELALGMLCCQPKNLEVWAPPGDLLGRIVQIPSVLVPEFVIENEFHDHLYRIEGQNNAGFCCFCPPKETYFKIYNGNDMSASIHRKWSQRSSQYTTNIYYSDPSMDIKSKALCLGAAFLMEYLYFQSKF